jgi:hypothetical protein
MAKMSEEEYRERVSTMGVEELIEEVEIAHKKKYNSTLVNVLLERINTVTDEFIEKYSQELQ